MAENINFVKLFKTEASWNNYYASFLVKYKKLQFFAGNNLSVPAYGKYSGNKISNFNLTLFS
jgi:hypothetical protein